MNSLDSLLSSLLNQTQPLHLLGTTPPTRAWSTLKLIKALRNEKLTNKWKFDFPIVILCSGEEASTELQANLSALSPLNDDEIVTAYFPDWEQSPYSPITPSIRTRLARLRVLALLCSKTEKPTIIITTIAAASQATLPPSYFRNWSLSLQNADDIQSHEELNQKLRHSGYLRADTVEDPGTFAIRGDIIDIFPVNRSAPIRIELFDTVIEKIREFDPQTQRVRSDTHTLISEVFIAPAREVPINCETAPLLRKNLKKKADDLDIPRSIRDPILHSIQEGSSPEHAEAWAPFGYSQTATLWEYFSPEALIIWDDQFSCDQDWQIFIEEQKLLQPEAIQSGRILPSVEDLFFWNTERKTKVHENSILYLDRMTLSSAEPTKGLYHSLSLSLPSLLSQRKVSDFNLLEKQLREWLQEGNRVSIFASTPSQLERIRFLLHERKISSIELYLGTLFEGFYWPEEKWAVITEDDFFASKTSKKNKTSIRPSERKSNAKSWSDLQALSDLTIGDLVVHRDHGVGRYLGISRLESSGVQNDFLFLEYANNDKLYLPIYRLNVVQRYSGGKDDVSLDRLGTEQFRKTKEKVAESVKKLAFDLVQLYAQRKISSGIPFSLPDSDYKEFEAQFPFEETPDQLSAIEDVLTDLQSGKIMDRIICGDVGYGKTEVAIRAAYRAVTEGKQVVVLVPTTLLAYQHEQSFKSRLKNHPFLIESISRLKTSQEQKKILQTVASGKIDIIIGTHRLLSSDVQFQDLGLVIIDEEHRFGVEHKERLKTLKVNTHVLTLTATPIPRTLHMALSGLRDVSLINTPPVDRLPIRTFVSKYDLPLIQRAIEFEISRGGQVFYLHNRVQSINQVASKLQELFPKISVLIAHGQMNENQLEKVMNSFYQKKADLLVCTTLIESGIDLSTANTIIIERADTLGLAQLYQIRGRVGRGQVRGYAYLLIPDEGRLTESAKKRLEVLQRFVELGSGFNIASHDLEIRGGGDLLGPQQSGSIAAVGFDLYTELLEDAVREMQGSSIESVREEPEIKAPFPALLSEEYVPDIHQRLSLYRRLSSTSKEEEITHLEEEIRDRFGKLTLEAQNLIWLIRIKLLLKNFGIKTLTVGPEKFSITLASTHQLDLKKTITLASTFPDQYQLKPDSRIIVKALTPSFMDLFFKLEKFINDFSSGEGSR